MTGYACDGVALWTPILCVQIGCIFCRTCWLRITLVIAATGGVYYGLSYKVLLGPHTTRGPLSVLRKTLPINRQESGPQDRIILLTVRSVSNNNIYSLKLPFYVFRKTAVTTTADNAVSKAGEIMVTIEIAVSKDTGNGS